jgi:hypothetical protein
MLPSIKVLFESTSINLLPVKGIAIEIWENVKRSSAGSSPGGGLESIWLKVNV